MANARMTLAMLSNELRGLSERVEQLSARIDARFEQIDTRFEQVDARFQQFADKIIGAFRISLEGMEAKLDAALDGTREQARRLDVFERDNTEEHRLMQAQIDDLDSRVRPRRRPRRS